MLQVCNATELASPESSKASAADGVPEQALAATLTLSAV